MTTPSAPSIPTADQLADMSFEDIHALLEELSRLKAGEGVELPDSDTIQRWVALAYREPEDLSRRDDFRFTRWNMEGAFMAGFDFARGETEHMPRPLPPAPGGRSDG